MYKQIVPRSYFELKRCSYNYSKDWVGSRMKLRFQVGNRLLDKQNPALKRGLGESGLVAETYNLSYLGF